MLEIYTKSARSNIKTACLEMGLEKTKFVFETLYGREGSKSEIQVLRNMLNRGSLTAKFLGLCVENLPPLQKLSARELYGITS